MIAQLTATLVNESSYSSYEIDQTYLAYILPEANPFSRESLVTLGVHRQVVDAGTQFNEVDKQSTERRNGEGLGEEHNIAQLNENVCVIEDENIWIVIQAKLLLN